MLRAMKRLQASQYELMPNGEQQRNLRRCAGSCRFVYNKALATQKALHERGEKKLNYAGEIDASRLSGLAAMSDGAAERLVSSDTSRVSLAIGKLLRGVAKAEVGRREIFGLLAEADFWKGTTGDDKSLALMARGLSAP
jgi:hypothetical protein